MLLLLVEELVEQMEMAQVVEELVDIVPLFLENHQVVEHLQNL